MSGFFSGFNSQAAPHAAALCHHFAAQHLHGAVLGRTTCCVAPFLCSGGLSLGVQA